MAASTYPAFQEPRLLSITLELLILILDQCQFIDLLSLSCTCRYLNTIAIHVYLLQFRLQQGLETKKIDLDSGVKSMHILHGLRSCIAPPKLDRITINFSDKANFVQDLHQLQTFISRSGGIREVRLYFGNTGVWFDGYNSASGPSQRASLKALFSMLAESGCEVLDVRQGNSVEFTDEGAVEQGMVLAKKCLAFLQDPITTILDLAGIPLAMVTAATKGSRAEMEDRSLRTFRLHSDLFFRRPFYSWMMDMFRNTPITSLSLQASNVWEEEWRSFLGSVSIPTLTHIAFVSPHISFSDILGFLSRHPSITSVYLPPHLTPATRLPQGWKHSLPSSITTVGGCHAYLRQLLNNRSSSFPKLENILFSLPPFKRDIKVITGAIGSIIERFSPRVLTLEFIYPSAHDEIDIYIQSEYSQPRSYSFSSVEEIRFRSDGSFALSERTLPFLSTWLATSFPSLKRLSFVNSCLFCEKWVWAEFVKSTRATCPLIEDITTYDAEDGRIDLSL